MIPSQKNSSFYNAKLYYREIFSNYISDLSRDITNIIDLLIKITQIFYDIIKKTTSENLIDSTPQQEILKVKGLPNIGNSCYIASVVQAFRSSLILKESLKQTLKQKSNESIETYKERVKIQQNLKNLIDSLETGNETRISTNFHLFREAFFNNKNLSSDLSIWQNKHEKIPNTTKSKLVGTEIKKDNPTGQQHDAQELMNLLLEVVGHEVMIKNKRESEEFKYTKEETLPYQIIQIPIQNTQTELQKLIDETFSKKKAGDSNNVWQSEIKGKKKEIKSWHEEVKIETKQPKVLVLALKRFRNDLSKNSTFIQSPKNLIIDFGKAFDSPKKSNLYKIVSSIKHLGSLNEGHYISNIKKNENWYRCNDGKISPISTLENDDEHFQNYLFILELV